MIFRGVEDTDLVRSAREGDVDAFNVLVSRWEKRVFNYILRLVANREDAMDLSQDVFLKAYQNLRNLETPERFTPWLYRIAHNEAFSLLRRRKPDESTDALAEHAGPGGARAADLSIAVAAALERLTPDQRETVLLKVYQGFKFDEIAEIAGAPVSTVKSRLYTALELLKHELAPAGTRGFE